MFTKDGVRLEDPEPGCECVLGVVIWDPREREFIVQERDIPLELLELAFGDRETYIGQAEELAAATVYWTHPEIFRDTCPIHFIDNQGTLGILTRGASHHAPMGRLAHRVAAQLFRLRARVWFEYVASHANIADLPSRHDSQLARRILRERFRARVRPAELTPPLVLPPLDAV